jgi:hypothetical protein
VGAWKASGEIRNLGAGGLFLGAATIPARGEKVWLDFRAPDGERVQAVGLVWWTTLDAADARRRSASPGFGVRLVHASQAYHRFLHRLAA